MDSITEQLISSLSFSDLKSIYNFCLLPENFYEKSYKKEWEIVTNEMQYSINILSKD